MIITIIFGVITVTFDNGSLAHIFTITIIKFSTNFVKIVIGKNRFMNPK